MKKKRPLAFVIIHYNDFPMTSRLLENIAHYQSISQIFVVDNHSSDDSFHQLQSFSSSKIKLIRTDTNKGFAAGMNVGVKAAITALGACDIILSNSDIIIYSDENLQRLQEVFKDPTYGILSPVVCEPQGLNRGWKVPSCGKEVLFNLPGVGKFFQKKYLQYPEKHYTGVVSFVEAVSGCFFLIKSEVLEKIGFFDEKTFLYYEENILSRKLQQANYHVALCNEVAVIHDHSVSVNKSISYINKYKILKESQYYFEKTYNHAGNFGLFWLRFTSQLTLITIYFRVFMKGGFRK